MKKYKSKKSAGKPIPLTLTPEEEAIAKHAKLLIAAPALLEACTADWDDLWQFFNWFASGKSQDQWSRTEPLAILGELYQRLAVIDCRRRAALAKAGVSNA